MQPSKEQPMIVMQQMPPMPPGMTHEEHQKQMKMGFDESRATHHFWLMADGGAIEVAANEAADAATRDAVRAHLREIERRFAAGDFAIPMAVHNEKPDGTNDLIKFKSQLTYTYEETPGGGRLRIRTADAKALSAVHKYLRYQIREHHTGDPVSVRRLDL